MYELSITECQQRLSRKIHLFRLRFKFSCEL